MKYCFSGATFLKVMPPAPGTIPEPKAEANIQSTALKRPRPNSQQTLSLMSNSQGSATLKKDSASFFTNFSMNVNDSIRTDFNKTL